MDQVTVHPALAAAMPFEGLIDMLNQIHILEMFQAQIDARAMRHAMYRDGIREAAPRMTVSETRALRTARGFGLCK